MVSAALTINTTDEQAEWIERAGQSIAGTQWIGRLAEYVGVSPGTLSNWRKGRIAMTPERWQLIIEALEVSASEARGLALAIHHTLIDYDRGDLALFEAVAENLYGPKWQTPVAKDMGVSLRWVNYCASGERPVRRGHFLTLAERLQDKADEREAIASTIRRYAGF